jgi:hypothetical protein
MIFAALAIVFVVVIAVVLAVVVTMGGGGNSRSAEGAFRGYVDGINSGNVRAALDHTIVKFVPNYDQIVSQLQSTLLYGNPHISIHSLTVIDNASMTSDQRAEATDIMTEIHSYLSIDVQDYAFVKYNMTLEYGIGGGPMTFDSEMLCVLVDGSWYVALTSYIQPIAAIL